MFQTFKFVKTYYSELNKLEFEDSKKIYFTNVACKLLDPAVFVYFIEVRFSDGVVFPYKGDVTLLR